MNTSVFLEALQRSVALPTNGIVGLVDDILERCRETGLQIEWREDRCVASLAGTEETVELPLKMSVFRALLARVSFLCGERVSPYGGSCEMLRDSGPEYHVEFVNTPAAQRLELIPVRAITSSVSCEPLPPQASSHSPGL